MRKNSRREFLSPDLTPLIDVVFLLLIFFMVSSVFKKEELSLLLNLPKTSEGKSKSDQKKQINIELSGEELVIDKEKVQFEGIDEVLSKFDPSLSVILRVDGDVRYERLVNVLDSLQKNKLENLSLITEKKVEN